MSEGALPTGTVTFLLTDIEGSTKLWQWHEDVMGLVVERHDELIAKAVADHGGVFVKSKGEGDSTFSVFTRPSDAVSAAIDAQRALTAEPWPNDVALMVRGALHTGEADLRDGDYYGTTVNRCARIRSAAHGGQAICSQATRDVVADALPGNASLHDLGTHRLRDLTQPERIFQLCHPELPSSFPPLRSLNIFLTNLPMQRTTFVGRERELQEIRDLVARHRLVTLTGVGGCGKTRLGLQLAAEEVDRFADGVYFVDLAPVTDPDVLPAVTAAAIGMTANPVGGGGSGRPVVEDLIDFLGGAAALIVLDNCEHLIDACGDFTDVLLERCPNLHILATSRELLGVAGEQTYAVPSLRVPDADETTTDCVDLFFDRAVSVRPGFVLTPENTSAIGEICRRLDGIPLAVELAAAQVPHLSPQQIAERLNDRFRLLTGGRRRVQRQQTLGATLDWSYELLSESERTLLCRLAVFPGPFSLAAAEDVCASPGAPTLPDLRGLIAKSLVTAGERLGEVRYRLLETVRLYAEDKLLESGEADALRGRHRDHYVSWLESIPEDLLIPGVSPATTIHEHHNIRAALEWSASEGRFDVVARLASRGAEIWGGGFADEGLRWLDTALSHRDELAREDIVRCLTTAAWVSNVRMDGEGLLLYSEEALAVAGDPSSAAAVFASALAAIYHGFLAGRGDVTAIHRTNALATTCVEAAEASGSSALRLAAYAIIGMAVANLGKFDQSIEYFDRAAALAKDLPNSFFAMGLPLSRKCIVLHLLGRDDEGVEDGRVAAMVGREALREYIDDIEVFDAGWMLFVGAPYALALASTGKRTEAREHLNEALRDRRHVRIPGMLGEVMVILAAIATDDGDWERASRLLAVARRELAFRSPPTYVLYRRCVEKVRSEVDHDTARRWQAEGAEMALDDAIQYGLDGIAEPAREPH